MSWSSSRGLPASAKPRRSIALAPSEIIGRISAGATGGHAAEGLVRQHGVIGAGRSFLQKPFTVEGLARKVRETLDATA